SRKDKKVLAYSFFRPGATPAEFLPELSSVDLSSESTLPPPKAGQKERGPPAVHIHHKFIVIDADTDDPTIYTGSANLSNNSTHKNDENLLEIKGNPQLARTYFAEFMRLYGHYRARALWNLARMADGPKRAERNDRKARTIASQTPLPSSEAETRGLRAPIPRARRTSKRARSSQAGEPDRAAATDSPRAASQEPRETSQGALRWVSRTRRCAMSDRDQINRRDFIVTTAGVAGSASALAGATLTAAQAQAQASPPPGFDAQEPFAKNWGKQLREVVNVDFSAA